MPSETAQYRYEEIADALRQRIADGDFNAVGKLPPEHALAAEFEVNRLTLRKAVGVLESSGLVTRHRGRGTFLGRMPSVEPAVRNYVYVGSVEEHVWSSVFAAIGAALQDQGHRLHVYQPGKDATSAQFEAWLATQTDAPAIICQRNQMHVASACAEASGSPLVIVDIIEEHAKPTAWPAVMPDVRRAGMIATESLLESGHQEIAFFGFGCDPGPGFPLPFPQNLAYSGYLDAMRYAGMNSDGLAVGGYGYGAPLQEALAAFIQHRGRWPTAFVCQQDYKARDLLAVAAAQGVRVPANVSIVSIGNTPWSEAMAPALTSVDLRPAAIGQLALQLLEHAGGSECSTCRIEPMLVPRHSVEPPPKH